MHARILIVDSMLELFKLTTFPVQLACNIASLRSSYENEDGWVELNIL